MTTGTLTAEAEPLASDLTEPLDASGEVSLHHEMVCIILETARDRRDGLIKPGITQAEAHALAADLVQRLTPAIGGRYVPKDLAANLSRKRRDEAVYAEFNGTNRDALMRKYGISRRLFYTILSRMRGVARMGARAAVAPHRSGDVA